MKWELLVLVWGFGEGSFLAETIWQSPSQSAKHPPDPNTHSSWVRRKSKSKAEPPAPAGVSGQLLHPSLMEGTS